MGFTEMPGSQSPKSSTNPANWIRNLTVTGGHRPHLHEVRVGMVTPLGPLLIDQCTIILEQIESEPIQNYDQFPMVIFHTLSTSG